MSAFPSFCCECCRPVPRSDAHSVPLCASVRLGSRLPRPGTVTPPAASAHPTGDFAEDRAYCVRFLSKLGVLGCLPLSLSFVVWLAQSVLDPTTASAQVLRLGFVLVCVWASLRWGDSLWVPPARFQYQMSVHALVGTSARGSVGTWFPGVWFSCCNFANGALIRRCHVCPRSTASDKSHAPNAPQIQLTHLPSSDQGRRRTMIDVSIEFWAQR